MEKNLANIIPLKIEGLKENIYPGFWLRLLANLFDLLIHLPLFIFLKYINSLNKYCYLYVIIPNLIIFVWYYMYLPKRFGGTPGKLIIGLKIVKMDSLQIRLSYVQ